MDNSYTEVLKRLLTYLKRLNPNHPEVTSCMDIIQSHLTQPPKLENLLSLDFLIKLNEYGIDMDFLITGMKTQKTILDDLFLQCPTEQKDFFLKQMFCYIHTALLTQKDVLLNYEKEVELLNFQFREKIHYNKKTVWHCIRKNTGLTQIQFAQELDAGLKYYRDVETLKTYPNLTTLARLYEKYGYYPSLVSPKKSTYLLILDKIWADLPTEVQNQIETLLKNDLHFMKQQSDEDV